MSDSSTTFLMCSGRLFEADRAVDGEAELGGDLDLVADGLKCFADQLFVRVRAVDLGRVEEGHAVLEGRADRFEALFLAAQAVRSWR